MTADMAGESSERRDAEVVVVGAGISGVAAAKCMRDAGFDVLLLERTSDVGGLWNFKENAYGVMSFTHINVSKYNYSFSDFPFPEGTPDYPHNVDMENYIRDYCRHFQLDQVIKFHTQVNNIEKIGERWHIDTVAVEEDEKGRLTETSKTCLYTAKFIAIATGHHAKPKWPQFPGQDTFTGQMIHSVSFNDAVRNGLTGQKVVVVGIGNSAIDVACNAASAGRCKPVYLSTRSGAWVVPNYVFGYPTDLYACRAFLCLPWQIATVVLENVINIVAGSPHKWGLNPKMHALQTQPSVSPTLIHHIQRNEVKIASNIQRIEGRTVHFENGESTEAHHLIFCTGYTIDLPFLSQRVRNEVLDNTSNRIKLYKNAFSPELGHDLAFIGFVQPASGGVLPVSEMQARWWAELCRGNVSLPSRDEMKNDMNRELESNKSRYFHSSRHTIQVDPLLYCDDIAAMIGAKPQLKKHPFIAWRLLIGSCGTSQWRLQGPHAWDEAERTVCRVPVAPLMLYGSIALLLLMFWFFWFVCEFFCDILEDIFD